MATEMSCEPRPSGDHRKLISENSSNNHRTLIAMYSGNDFFTEFEKLVHEWYLIRSLWADVKVLWCHSRKTKERIQYSRRLREDVKKRKKQSNGGPPLDVTFAVYSVDLMNVALGQTFNVVVLQDFGAIQPEHLCQAVETAAGGGLVIIDLPCPLSEIVDHAMDVHKSWGVRRNTVKYFNARFGNSLANELRSPTDKPKNEKYDFDSLAPEGDDGTVSSCLRLCKTFDQAKCLLSVVDGLISDKRTPVVISVQSARGRGKSALLGLSLGCMVIIGSRTKTPQPHKVVCTAPDPDCMKTMFYFLDMVLRSHFEVSSTTEGRNLNVRLDDKTTLSFEYVSPIQAAEIASKGSPFYSGQMLVIDEAASITSSLAGRILHAGSSGYHRILMASTCAGYEGTGRSLSLKHLKKLERERGDDLIQLKLSEPIRYAKGDPVETWLNTLLCLPTEHEFDASYPSLESTDLFVVNKEKLMLENEAILKRIVWLFSTAHYRNSPNDLQLLADSDKQHLLVLAPSIAVTGQLNSFDGTDICVVVQVAEEGRITRSRQDGPGTTTSGDMSSWTLNSHFLSDRWLQAMGLRILRIATHPKCQRMGYGKRTVQLLLENMLRKKSPSSSPGSLLAHISQSTFKRLPDYVSVSYGITDELLKFWRDLGFQPMYFRLSSCPLTGEHSCLMVRPTSSSAAGHNNNANDMNCFSEQAKDFHARFIHMLRADELRQLQPQVCQRLLSRTSGQNHWPVVPQTPGQTAPSRKYMLKDAELCRLQRFWSDMVEHHIIIDLLPRLAFSYFLDGRWVDTLSVEQQNILLAIGAQGKTLQQTSAELGVPVAQVRALINRILKIAHVTLTSKPTETNGEPKRKRKIAVDLDDVL